MSLIQKFSESIKTEGIFIACKRMVRTIIIRASLFFDRFFDLKYKTNTCAFVKLEDLAINSENKIKGVEYQATRESNFRVMMRKIQLPLKENVFIDFGSGKGRTLLLASSYATFKKVIGVEFSSELCDIARKNVQIYQSKTTSKTPIEIFDMDALKYEFNDDENVIYMANPFDGDILANLLTNIRKSLERKQRDILLIYNNPIFHKVIDECDFLEKSNELFIKRSISTIMVYTNKKA